MKATNHNPPVASSGENQVRVYRATDAPPGALDGESVVVIGYGHLGRTAALNLRDSGARVRIGNREDEYATLARSEGFEVMSIPAAAAADILFVLLPDEVIPSVFDREIAPALKPGSAIAFGSGYSLAYGLIHPPDSVDVLLVAPRMAGDTARARYVAGLGFWGCIGVEADRSGRAERRMLGLANGLGILRAGAIQMSARLEAAIDLFVEQTVGTVFGTAIMTAFEVAHKEGMPAEALVLEMYMSGEMETVFQSFRQTGFFRASEDHGPTALYGGFTRSLALDRGAMAETFRKTLKDIQNGGFARRFQEEAGSGYPMLDLAKAMIHGPSPITDAEDRLRRMTSSSEPERAITTVPGDAPLDRPGAAPALSPGSRAISAMPRERRAAFPIRLLRAPRLAWSVWRRVPEGTPWMYKLLYVGAHLKSSL